MFYLNYGFYQNAKLEKNYCYNYLHIIIIIITILYFYIYTLANFDLDFNTP